NLMRKQLGDELGTDSVALEKLENAPETAPPTIHPATHHANHPAASDEFAAAAVPDYLHEDPDEQLPPAQDHSADTLAPLVYKALCAIVRRPVLANQLTLPATEAESEQERLLLEVLKKLQQSPQSSSIGLLIQWIGSPYQSELQRIAELPKHDIPPAASDIEAVLKQMNARQLSAELRHLTQRFERGEKLSPEELARKLYRQKQINHIHKARARIYNHNPH